MKYSVISRSKDIDEEFVLFESDSLEECKNEEEDHKYINQRDGNKCEVFTVVTEDWESGNYDTL